jgi:pSer/pThr/pTyr-binding forkhead associated (FHA) protein
MPRVTITVPEKTAQPYRFDLNREVVAIGRNNDNDIVVGCGSVSGKHAEMKRVKRGYQLIDIGSTNGIKVDGVRSKLVALETGMTLKLGDVEFGFTLTDEELAVLATEVDAEGSATSKEEKKEEISEKTSEKPASKDAVKEDDDEDDDEDEDDDLDKLPELPPEKKSKEKPKEEKAEKPEKKKKEPKQKEEKSSKPERQRNIEAEDEEDEPRLSKSVSIGSGFILFALIVAAAAFLYGANARHEKDTGEGLLKAVVNKEDVTKDAPPEPEAGAE